MTMFNDDRDAPLEVQWQGRFVQVATRGKWEFAGRPGGIRAAVIVAMHDDQVILVDQYRVPLGKRCLELPAGLIGDETEGESVEVAAARELEEETGYRAGRIELLGEYFSSPGMLSEGFTLVRAHDLTRVSEGGGTEDEDIIVHHVRIADLPTFVAAKRAEGMAIDVKMLLLLGQSLLGQSLLA